MPSKTVAIIQHPAKILDSLESSRRATAHIADAASRGAELIVFPESWLSCYPAWVFGMAGWDDPLAKHWYQQLLADSLVIGRPDQLDDDLATLREAAREHQVTVVMGMNERSSRHGGSLYNSLVTIGTNGHILNVHRKLTPTHTERTAWASGDASGLKVIDTPAGRLGGLICWEHWHPLARQALHAQDEQIHVAAWPDMPEMHHIASRAYAFEGRCYVVCAGQFLSAEDVPDSLLEAYRRGVGADAPANGLLFSGGSAVIAPDGSWVTPPLVGEPGIVMATLDLAVVDAQRQDLDVAGHYSRPDIFELRVDRRRRTSVNLRDDLAGNGDT